MASHSTKSLMVMDTSWHDEQYALRLVPMVELDAIEHVSVGGVLRRLRTTQQNGAGVLLASNVFEFGKA